MDANQLQSQGDKCSSLHWTLRQGATQTGEHRVIAPGSLGGVMVIKLVLEWQEVCVRNLLLAIIPICYQSPPPSTSQHGSWVLLWSIALANIL